MHRYLELARKTIRELRDRGVVLDAHDDLETLSEIMLCARRVLEPTDPALARRLLSPVVTVGGAQLRCLPIGVDAVLGELLGAVPCNELDVRLAEAYAAAHTQTTAFWQSPPSPRAFLRLVRRWARRLDATVIELVTALDELKLREYAVLKAVAGTTGGGMGLHLLLETLVREYGKDHDHWLWVAGNDEVESKLSAMAERGEADRKEFAKAEKRPMVSADSYEFRAMNTLIALRDRIVKERVPDVET